jgi:hypothetical protein
LLIGWRQPLPERDERRSHPGPSRDSLATSGCTQPRCLVKQGAVPLPPTVLYLIPVHLSDPLACFTSGQANPWHMHVNAIAAKNVPQTLPGVRAELAYPIARVNGKIGGIYGLGASIAAR